MSTIHYLMDEASNFFLYGGARRSAQMRWEDVSPDVKLFTEARIGKSFIHKPTSFLLFFKVNGQRVSVSVQGKCPMHEIVQFVAREKKVPARLVKYDGSGYDFGCAELIYNS